MSKPRQGSRNVAAAIGLIVAIWAGAACRIQRGASGAPDAPADGPAPTPELVVARVNGDPIEARELDELLDAEMLGVLRRGPGPAEEVGARGRALDLAIAGELLVQAAREEGLSVPSERIDAELQVARSQFGSQEEFERSLTEAGSSPARLRARIERRLLLGEYVRRLTGHVVVDEAEARQLFEREKARFREGEQVRAEQILIRLRPQASTRERAEARAKMDRAARRLDAGEPFAEVARDLSEAPSAVEGGDLGFLGRGQTLPEFEEVVFATPAGSLTPVFETRHGINLVRVVERRAGRQRSFDEVKTGLMMVLARERQDEDLLRHVAELRERASIEILPAD